MSFPIRAACVFVLSLLTACNQSSPRSVTNAFAHRSNEVTPASAALMQALYDDADAAREQGEAALQTYLAGPTPPRTQPQFASAHFRLGNIYEKRGATSSARAAYTEALRLNPQCKDARAALDKLK